MVAGGGAGRVALAFSSRTSVVVSKKKSVGRSEASIEAAVMAGAD